MSDINAAPSSTEPVPQTAPADTALAVGGAENAVAVPQNAPLDTEAGTAVSGESFLSAANATASESSAEGQVTSLADARSGDGDTESSSTGFAESGDAGNADATGAAASSGSAATANDANETGAETGNAAASPAADQSASDTASSAPPASQGDDTAADALRSEIASFEQQLTDAHAEVAKWQGLYNAATSAKPHVSSVLQKLEAGEAIVMGDLHAALRKIAAAL